jgi:hypothetical protein
MRARTKTCALLCTAIASFSLSGCAGAGPTNPTNPPPIPAVHNQWIWAGGPKVTDQAGIYGTQGIAASGNVPGAREQAISWTDASGDFWLFGGNGYDSSVLSNGGGTNVIELGGYLNDLWKYSGGQWAWMGGSNLADQPAVYGTQGTPNQNNIPGPRYGGVSWTDPSGSLWLFGGGTYTVTGNVTDFSTISFLNDLWKYSAGQWTWMGGSSTPNQPGIYGTQGVAAPGNVPGGRYHALSWTDSSGNFWLFGGEAIDSTGAKGNLNDLWKYSGGQWTWMGGSSLGYQAGIYGTQGTAAPTNIPGAREQAFSWIDSSGTLWLFGGNGSDSQGTYGFLNDLWRYSEGQWTWMSGSNTAGSAAVYGTQGTAAPANTPGARNSGVSWTDTSGNLWLFGGGTYNSTTGLSYLNDVWKYSAGQWTWMGGSNTGDQNGTYGTEGTPAPANVPSGRFHEVSWTDSSGKLWLFGGNTPDPNPTLRSVGVQDYLSDLWTYQP